YNPRDYPNKYVLRPHYVTREGSTVGAAVVTESLEQARARVPPGCHFFPRMLGDDPVIVECWMQ
ncbi:MAG TPA: hypothetical protein VF821_22175, partial [Lentzea sp.]